jgi:hypothetical protein
MPDTLNGVPEEARSFKAPDNPEVTVEQKTPEQIAEQILSPEEGIGEMELAKIMYNIMYATGEVELLAYSEIEPDKNNDPLAAVEIIKKRLASEHNSYGPDDSVGSDREIADRDDYYEYLAAVGTIINDPEVGGIVSEKTELIDLVDEVKDNRRIRSAIEDLEAFLAGGETEDSKTLILTPLDNLDEPIPAAQRMLKTYQDWDKKSKGYMDPEARKKWEEKF